MEADELGQDNAALEETTAESPELNAPSEQTTDNGPGAEQEESFFDYNEIKGKPELEAAYKQMQGAFTKKMTTVSESNSANKEAIDAYNAFMANPQGETQRLAQQYGINAQQEQPEGNQEFSPNSWDDVISHVRTDLLKELQPLFTEVQASKKHTIEMQLDSQYPDWRTYEEQMTANLQKHPSLAEDHSLLYRMSVPEKVMTSRATQQALNKLKNQNNNAQVSGGGSTARNPQTSAKVGSFSEALQKAKNEIAERQTR